MHKLNLDSQSSSTSHDQPDDIPAVGPGTTTTTDQTAATAQPQTPVDDLPATDNNVSSSMKKNKLVVFLSLIAILGGVATGYGGYKLQAQSHQTVAEKSADMDRVAEGAIQAGDVFGVQDEKTFKDSVEGYLEIGGLNGEGSHKLIRPGGDSQIVYLTSSITDLDKFDGMEIKVWGETFKGQKAGWLMDVGRVEVLNPEGELPTE